MKTKLFCASALAAALLSATASFPSAQTSDPNQDAHHPEQTLDAPAAQPEAPEASQEGDSGTAAPGTTSMNPQMMQMMQNMMRMQEAGRGQPGMAMTGGGMMGQGSMGPGMMPQGMMRMMVIMMDADGDGALSLDEFQAVHERMFKAMDSDGDSRVTVEDLQAFMGGMAGQGPQMPMRQGMSVDRSQGGSSPAYMAAMQTMMEGMASMQMTGDPATDFAMMMIPHHQSAIDMAQAYLQHGDDPELTRLANDIVSAQQEEIEFLQKWLRERR